MTTAAAIDLADLSIVVDECIQSMRREPLSVNMSATGAFIDMGMRHGRVFISLLPAQRAGQALVSVERPAVAPVEYVAFSVRDLRAILSDFSSQS